MTTTAKYPVMRRARNSGFSLIEVLFAIGMLGLGIVGILALFTTGLSAAAWSGNMTSAAMEAQSLYTRVVAETDKNTGQRIYLKRIKDPNLATTDPKPDNMWIHNDSNQEKPEQVDLDRDLWWQCRVSKYPMDKDDPMNPNKDGDQKAPQEPMLPTGLYQIAIAIYRSWKPGKDPLCVYTTYVTAGY
ncbi:MAG TPA: hypothetical protein VEK08_01280 [Planctomycetota bacterium]|nr:hypothetical protein [Planctomycetota bacterium]